MEKHEVQCPQCGHIWAPVTSEIVDIVDLDDAYIVNIRLSGRSISLRDHVRLPKQVRVDDGQGGEEWIPKEYTPEEVTAAVDLRAEEWVAKQISHSTTPVGLENLVGRKVGT